MSYFCEKTERAASRRQFLEKAGLGFGGLAASFLLGSDSAAGGDMEAAIQDVL